MSDDDDRPTVTSVEARQRIESGACEPIRVNGLLDLRGLNLPELPPGLSCFDLDATGSELRALPDDIQIDSRLILDDCILFERLPTGLRVGSLRARRAMSLQAMPDGLDAWFLDLEGSARFHRWPEVGTVHHGQVSLRGCLDVQLLPPWVERLATLDLGGCANVRHLPDGLTVSRWIDVGGTRITELPASLRDCRIRWRGVDVPERLAFRPETITAAEVMGEDNAEVRRVMIERMGYQRFADEAGGVVVDADTDPGGDRQLLRIELQDDEPLVGLSCFCPSTGQQYLLRVPPTTSTCHQAAAWLAGFDDPTLYRPVIET